MGNSSLTRAKVDVNDEFYTQLETIEQEVAHYREHFKDKVVYLNCDDPRESNFFHYFSYNFERLGLKKLISSCYKSQDHNLFSLHDTNEKAVWLEYTGEKDGGRVPTAESIGVNHFKGDGDFRSQESIDLLKQADIVVTNPPFSLFREYVSQLIEYDKEFLIIGRADALIYKDIFPLVRDGKMWQGISNGNMTFKIPSDTGIRNVFEEDGEFFASFGNIVWWTNLEYPKRYEDIILFKDYDKSEYSMYDNYDAINIDRVVNIPKDYKGYMGVPVSFISKWNPNQFELIGITRSWDDPFIHNGSIKSRDPIVNGIGKYTRLLIQNKYLNPEIYAKDTEDNSANTKGEEI